jgi:hypothetical protein
MTARWRVSDDVVWAGDEGVRLYNAGTGEFQTLNETGSAIWCLMAGGKDADQIAEELAEEHGGGHPLAKQHIAEEVGSFLRVLADQKMVVRAEHTAAALEGDRT